MMEDPVPIIVVLWMWFLQVIQKMNCIFVSSFRVLSCMMQRSRGAEEQRSRGAEVQRCRGVGAEQGCRGAEQVQRCRCAEYVQRFRVSARVQER